MVFQVGAVAAHQAGPAIGVGDGAGVADFAPLVVHFEEEEVGQLLDVVAVGEAVVAQDGTVVPQALDDGGGLAHQILF